MYGLNFVNTTKRVSLNPLYVTYAALYGLGSLVIPFSAQYLVNNLALAGIWFNTITFLLIITCGLFGMLFFKFCQIIVKEYLQREIFDLEMKHWESLKYQDKSYYFFELPQLTKSYALAFTNFVEMLLVVVFGLVVITFFHPYFILIPALIILSIYFMYRSLHPAIKSSINESNKKYEIYYSLKNAKYGLEFLTRYLLARHAHFRILRNNTLIVLIFYLITQIFLLGVGAYLVQASQLSVGQLVGAEIILSGVLGSLLKLPSALESMYDYETSHYKMSKAFEE